MEYIGLQAMEVVMKKERMSAALRVEAYRMCHAGRTSDTKKVCPDVEYGGRTGPMTADTKKENMTGHAERHGRTADTKKVCPDVEYGGRTGPMTADTKKENMTGHAERHGKTERHGRTADTKKVCSDVQSIAEGRDL
uniref:Uncharacterized protein n=1 Tax=Tanacetum cinerariifolium TaxID=118510 RepID=A0A699R5T8_TANCI|nr:hypothetical protein [Tanacetum cinerariifolium]